MIYLDNSATTRVSDNAQKKMIEAAGEIWGNPSSLHDFGLNAEKFIKTARNNIMESLRVDKKEGQLVFTGSGTEANNLAIFGTAYAKNRGHKKIITDNSQHASVLRCLERLEEDGFEVVRLSTKNGQIDLDEVRNAVDNNTVLISIMLVNNETGAIYDVKSAFDIAKKINPNIVTHTDAIQGYKKISFSPSSLGADLVSISGHKIHAPKGIGALWISSEMIKTKKIRPYILGGGQESGFRSGTENVPAIAAFGEASKEKFEIENAKLIRQYLLDNLPNTVTANIPTNPAPHIISLTLPRIKSETMLHYLSFHDIYVSSGSACSSHGHSGGTLIAFGLNEQDADCTIRVSLNGSESTDVIDCFISILNDGINSLVKINK